jgi:hypothetical protein
VVSLDREANKVSVVMPEETFLSQLKISSFVECKKNSVTVSAVCRSKGEMKPPTASYGYNVS